jgi:hypothetical protein
MSGNFSFVLCIRILAAFFISLVVPSVVVATLFFVLMGTVSIVVSILLLLHELRFPCVAHCVDS